MPAPEGLAVSHGLICCSGASKRFNAEDKNFEKTMILQQLSNEEFHVSRGGPIWSSCRGARLLSCMSDASRRWCRTNRTNRPPSASLVESDLIRTRKPTTAAWQECWNVVLRRQLRLGHTFLHTLRWSQPRWGSRHHLGPVTRVSCTNGPGLEESLSSGERTDWAGWGPSCGLKMKGTIFSSS